MKDKTQVIGGLLIIIFFISCICTIWVEDKIFWFRILCTEVALIYLFYVLDKLQKL